MLMVHAYRLFILLSTAAARKASWERTLPGSRDSSTTGAALRRKAKFDVLRKKALKNGHEELAAAIDELKRRDAALTEAERANRRPKPPHGAKGFGYAHGDEGVDDDDPQLDMPPAVVEVEEDAEDDEDPEWISVELVTAFHHNTLVRITCEPTDRTVSIS